MPQLHKYLNVVRYKNYDNGTKIFLISIYFNFFNMNVMDCTDLKFDENDRAYLIIKENLFTGKCETFHKNGIKAMENNYNNGLLNGKSFIWHSTGELQLRSQYSKGNRIGMFITYFINGNIESETEYGENERIIRMIRYKESGEVLMKIGE